MFIKLVDENKSQIDNCMFLTSLTIKQLHNIPWNLHPIMGGDMVPNPDGTGSELFEPREIYGTAFSIGNNLFITCKHTIESASSCPAMGLAYIDSMEMEQAYKLVTIDKTFLSDDIDAGIIMSELPVDYKNAIVPLRWLKQTLSYFSKTASMGYAYGYDKAERSIAMRAFQGYVSTAIKRPEPYYELSYQVPRGLSGAPLLYLDVDDDAYVCGMTFKNDITDMIVFSSKETDKQSNKEITYHKTEAFHRGIAFQNEELFKIKSDLLNGLSLGEYLAKNNLLA